MKKKLLISIVTLLVVAAVIFIVAHQTNARHVSDIQAEIKLLEAVLEEAAGKWNTGTIEENEIRSYNERIVTHLGNVDEHPWSAPIIGYSDFHLDIFADLIETLEDSKEEHNDMLVAFNTDSLNTDAAVDLPEPSPGSDTVALPASSTTAPDTDGETGVFDDALLAFNFPLYCPGTDPDCWDPNTYID